MEYLVVVAVVVLLFALYLVWVAGRLDRLHRRVAAGRQALDTQLRHRASAAVAVVDAPAVDAETHVRFTAVHRAAQVSLEASADAEATANDLSRALRAAVPLALRHPSIDPSAIGDLAVSNRRLGVARQVYNDAVRDTLGLRRRKVVRALRMSRRYPRPSYFDIDECDLSALDGRAVAVSTVGQAHTDSEQTQSPT